MTLNSHLVLDGLEQVELDGGLVLAPDMFPDEDEPIARIPRLRLPATLEVVEPACHGPPSSSAFDHRLERGEALEGHRDGEGDAQGVKSLDDVLVEEGAVDAHLSLCPRQALAHRAYTALDEGVGAVGVVDVSGPMVHVEHLVGLGDGAKQRVVAARALLRLVEPHRGAFGMTPGAQHRPVEVEGDAREPFALEALEDHRPRLGADVTDAALVGTAERATDGGHVGQSLQAKHPLD